MSRRVFTDRYLEGADRITVGTADYTFRIWKELVAAGEEGLTRGEILELVGPHINHGYARRRYLKERKRMHRNYSPLATRVASGEPTWETTELEPALNYVVTKALSNMRRDGSAILLPDGRHKAGRKPRFQAHREATIDMTGKRTRLHMNGVEALRIIEPALERHRASSRAQPTAREWDAIERLVALYREQMAAGFPDVD